MTTSLIRRLPLAALLVSVVAPLTAVAQDFNFNTTIAFSDANTGPVHVVSACDTGTGDAADISVGDPAEALNVAGFADGDVCIASAAPIPAGYTQLTSPDCVIGGVTAAQADVDCSLTFELNIATFTVNKEWDDGNTASVDITLVCTSGTVTTPTLPASGVVPAQFEVTGFVEGATCTATEVAPAGYTPDESQCLEVGLVEPGGCTIANLQDAVTVTVTKAYSVAHPTADPEVEMTLTCPTATVDGGTSVGSSTTVDGVATFQVTAFPSGGESCVATETVPAGYVQSDATGCDALQVAPGAAAPECTITNRPTEAVFTVDKNFSDSNPQLAASVTPVCTDAGGGPGITYDPASGDALQDTDFSTTVMYFAGATNCTASEVDLVGYTQDLAQSTCDEGVAVDDATDGSCIIFNQQDSVTILASKAYEGDSGPAATFAGSCAAGTLTAINTSASPGSPAEFELSDFPWDGTTCDVTEPVPPAGYSQTGSTCNGLAIVPSDDDTLCTITNAETVARFHVTKDFSDGSTDEVRVTLTCNTGLPLTQSLTIAGGDSAGVTFVVTDYVDGTMSCSVTEVTNTPGYDPDTSACVWNNVLSIDSPFACVVDNAAQDATFTANMEWNIDGAGGGDVPVDSVLVTITCNNTITGGQSCGADCYEISKVLGDGGSLVAKVDTTLRSASCGASQAALPSSVESTDDCGSRTITAGQSDSCLFVNTVFFEGIPTLNQYGLAILALLMLGVGFVGFRRFV